MRYNFNTMDSDSFELMVRSLNEKIFGIKCEQYGSGPDGQREFTFDGDITDMSGTVFKGRTIGQVKFKYPTTNKDDYKWLEKEIDNELKRFCKKDKEYIPENYLFYTNIVLTPTKDTGVKDKINKFIKENNNIIPYFYVKGYDEICTLLDNNRDVATAYSSHILPGDILIQYLKEENSNYTEILGRYLARELEEDMCTQMEQAGSVTEKKVSIEKVYIDIDVKELNGSETFKFVHRVLDIGNKVLGYQKQNLAREKEIFELDKSENFVLVGGPGGGKTTICQFVAQIYRANYLQATKYTNIYAKSFMQEIEESYSYNVNCQRVPFKVILKEYAAWINRQEKDANISIINYMRDRIKKIEGSSLSISEIRKMITQLAWIFFFDGLDEVPETSNRQEVLRQINIFISIELKEDNCDCMIIATTRMQGYNKDFNENCYEHLEVMELSEKDCVKYINKLFKEIEERTEKREEYIRIMKEALKDSTTNRLMKTPLQAAIIAILVKSGGKPPHERYSLFHQYYDIVVKREKQKEVIPTLNDKTEWLEQIHLIVAEKLQRESEKDENPSAEISKADLRQIIRKYIEDNRDEFYEGKETYTKEKDFLKIIAERVCFLCENREEYYSFTIRTLQEYFAGTYFVKNSDSEAIQNIRKIAYKLYWRNTFLFALGYIELHKEYLEGNIGKLCEEMNGIDNLTKADYTSENICLYGSWLAIDILAEDIFKGKSQDKYIRYAAEAIKLSGCKMFSKFSVLTGVQCKKLHDYIKDKYEMEKMYLTNVLSLYIVLHENKRNNLEGDIVSLLKRCDEKDQINLCIRLLDKDVYYTNTAKNEWKALLTQYIKAGKVKQRLPQNVLEKLIFDDIRMKRFLLLQCICDESIHGKFVKKALGISDIKISGYFRSRRLHLITHEIKLTNDFKYNFYEFELNDLEEYKNLARKLELHYVVKTCEFLVDPTYDRYKELLCISNEEERDIVRRNLRNAYFEYGEKTEEEFNLLIEDRMRTLKLIKQQDIKELMRKNKCFGLEYSATCFPRVFDDLMEKQLYTDIQCLGDVFLVSYAFAAAVQIESWVDNNAIEEITVDRLIILLKEMNQRKLYACRIFTIIIFILKSNYYTRFKRVIQNLDFIENMSDMQITNEILYRSRLRNLDENSEKIILIVVRHTINLAEENYYLVILLQIFMKKGKFSAHISSDDMIELERIDYRNEYNKLAVYLLKLCNCEDENLEELIECIVSVGVPKKMLYSVMANILHNCKISNRDKLWVLVYYHLKQENFQGQEELLNKMINNMIEIKGNS
ncbi:hypothetical protein C808_03711 [Lachnospiraceae bacterium M18-1]|nr:hypothetical protein C808_03711 [Lachnospiraceae bacterium M18-1]